MLTVYGYQQTQVAPNIIAVIPMLESEKNSTKSSSAATSFHHKAKPLPQFLRLLLTFLGPIRTLYVMKCRLLAQLCCHNPLSKIIC